MKRLVIVALVAAGCSGHDSKKQPEQKPAPAEAKAPAAPPAAGKATKPAPARPAPPSKAALANYRKHLSAGRKLAAREEWKKAAAELELALKAIPDDGRALSELGWVAFQAGDYDRARTVNAASVRFAAQAVVKAASLYNLGRVAEAQGNQKQAAEHYRESLRLRPGNKAVTKRLAHLGETPPEVGEFDGKAQSECSAPVAKDQLCSCESADLGDPEDEGVELACDVEDAPLPGFAYVNTATTSTTSFEASSSTELAMKLPDGRWKPAALLTSGTGGRGHTEDWDVSKLEKRKVGAREILWIEVSSQISDMSYDTASDYEEMMSYVIICTLPDVTCGHRFPVYGSYSSVPVDVDNGFEPTGKPDESGFRADLTLAPDGKATLTLVSGDRGGAEGFLGTHELW